MSGASFLGLEAAKLVTKSQEVPRHFEIGGSEFSRFRGSEFSRFGGF